MTDVDTVRARISQIRPSARFVACTHSSTFIDPGAQLGEGFYYVNLYDTKIDSNVIASKRGLILIHNTYLPSFAYNLFLCWLACEQVPTLDRQRLLKHNFKKYFSEQLLRANPNIFARAVFLETLLYEQSCMVPVFEERGKRPDLDRLATFGAELMSSAVSFHELGHYYLGRDLKTWDEVIHQYADTVGPVWERMRTTYPPAFATEFQCDVISLSACLGQYREREGIAFFLRAFVFAFAAFAVLSSLTKSAEKTAADQRGRPDEVDFASIQKQHRDFSFSLGVDRDFVERARLVAEVAGNLARVDQLNVFSTPPPLALPTTLVDELLVFIDEVMESDDRNAREMSLLMAEALHDHPRGLDYLFLRSRTFTFGPQRNPDGTLKPD